MSLGEENIEQSTRTDKLNRRIFTKTIIRIITNKQKKKKKKKDRLLLDSKGTCHPLL